MKDTFISIRLDRELLDKLNEVSRARGEHRSSFIRRAILRELKRVNALSEDEMKYLVE